MTLQTRLAGERVFSVSFEEVFPPPVLVLSLETISFRTTQSLNHHTPAAATPTSSSPRKTRSPCHPFKSSGSGSGGDLRTVDSTKIFHRFNQIVDVASLHCLYAVPNGSLVPIPARGRHGAMYTIGTIHSQSAGPFPSTPPLQRLHPRRQRSITPTKKSHAVQSIAVGGFGELPALPCEINMVIKWPTRPGFLIPFWNSDWPSQTIGQGHSKVLAIMMGPSLGLINWCCRTITAHFRSLD